MADVSGGTSKVGRQAHTVARRLVYALILRVHGFRGLKKGMRSSRYLSASICVVAMVSSVRYCP